MPPVLKGSRLWCDHFSVQLMDATTPADLAHYVKFLPTVETPLYTEAAPYMAVIPYTKVRIVVTNHHTINTRYANVIVSCSVDGECIKSVSLFREFKTTSFIIDFESEKDENRAESEEDANHAIGFISIEMIIGEIARKTYDCEPELPTEPMKSLEKSKQHIRVKIPSTTPSKYIKHGTEYFGDLVNEIKFRYDDILKAKSVFGIQRLVNFGIMEPIAPTSPIVIVLDDTVDDTTPFMPTVSTPTVSTPTVSIPTSPIPQPNPPQPNTQSNTTCKRKADVIDVIDVNLSKRPCTIYDRAVSMFTDIHGTNYQVPNSLAEIVASIMHSIGLDNDASKSLSDRISIAQSCIYGNL